MADRLLYARVAASSALSNSDVETALDDITLPTIRSGGRRIVRFSAVVQVTGNATASSVAVRVRFGASGTGGTAVASASGAAAASTFLGIDGEITLRPDGTGYAQVRRSGFAATATVATPGVVVTELSGIGATPHLVITGDWVTANAGNSVRIESFNIWEHVRG
jgi:hypothetical protein